MSSRIEGLGTGTEFSKNKLLKHLVSLFFLACIGGCINDNLNSTQKRLCAPNINSLDTVFTISKSNPENINEETLWLIHERFLNNRITREDGETVPSMAYKVNNNNFYSLAEAVEINGRINGQKIINTYPVSKDGSILLVETEKTTDQQEEESVIRSREELLKATNIDQQQRTGLETTLDHWEISEGDYELQPNQALLINRLFRQQEALRWEYTDDSPEGKRLNINTTNNDQINCSDQGMVLDQPNSVVFYVGDIMYYESGNKFLKVAGFIDNNGKSIELDPNLISGILDQKIKRHKRSD